MPEPFITGATILGATQWIASSVAGGIIGNRSDDFAKNNWAQLRENLNRYRPESNHELQRAVYRAYLQSTLQCLAIFGDEMGIDVDSRLSPHALPDFLPKSIFRIRREKSKKIFIPEDEDRWFNRASADISEKLDDLRNEKLDPPSAVDNAEFTALMNRMELLIQPGDEKERESKIREALILRVIDDLDRAYSDKHGDIPAGLVAAIRERWFELLCACFQQAIKKQDDIANIFQSKLLAKIYFQNDRGQTAEISSANLKEQLDRLSSELADVIRAESQRVIDKVDQVPDRVVEKLLAISPSQFGSLAEEKAIPVSIHLDINAKIIDRETECSAVLDELRKKDGRRVIPIISPAGFGKTSLVIKTLQQVTDGEKLTDSSVNAVLTVDCSGDGISLGKLFERSGRLIGQSFALQRLYANQELSLKEKLEKFFDLMAPTGNVWIVLDNFEDCLDGDSIKDNELSQFIEICLKTNNRLRIILTTRRLPALKNLQHLSALSSVNDGLRAGLPETDAVAYLRREGGAECGLSEDKIGEKSLLDFCRRVHFIPMALKSVVGYLRRSYPAVTLADLLKNREILSDFDRHDYEEGLNKLLEAQFGRLLTNEIKILRVISFFNNPLPQDALEYFLPKADLARVLGALGKDEILESQRDRLGTNRYSLHPIIRRHRSLKIDEDDSIIETGLAEHCMGTATRSYNKTFFRQSADLFDCSVAIYRNLAEGPRRDELANDLAMALMNKGNALLSLGRLPEALSCCDEAIDVFRQLVSSGRDELANDLARALMNKGNALLSLGRLPEALSCCDEAIDVFRQLVSSGRDELANDLARALIGKGVALRSLGRLPEALSCYDEAIDVIRQLVSSGRDELANDLAMALMNKGVALMSLGRLPEALSCYDEAIDVRRQLVSSGRDDLANDLAMALMNKGVALMSLGRLPEALSCCDEAIDVFRQLVSSGRDELANDLARALMNKGNALQSLGRLPEALSCYDEAIDVIRQLVSSGRDELANDLARALMNKGNALLSLGRLPEALSCCDEAIDVIRQLVSSGPR